MTREEVRKIAKRLNQLALIPSSEPGRSYVNQSMRFDEQSLRAYIHCALKSEYDQMSAKDFRQEMEFVVR